MSAKTILEKIKITPLVETLRMEKIDDSIYFSEKYSGYISNSRLKLINPSEGGSCQQFIEGLAANNQYNSSFALGTAVHSRVLQPEYFILAPALDKPSGKTGVMADIIYKYGDGLVTRDRLKDAAIKADFYHGIPSANQLLKAEDKILPYIEKRSVWDKNNTDDREVLYLSNSLLETANGTIDSISQNQAIQNLLHPIPIDDSFDMIIENEQAILLNCVVSAPDIPEFEIRLKSKLDNYVIDPLLNTITINDVKTTSSELPYFGSQIDKYSYFREISMYMTLLKIGAEKNFGIKDPEVAGNFLAVQTKPPYESAIYPMSDEMFKRGSIHFMYLLRLAALALHFKENGAYCRYINNL